MTPPQASAAYPRLLLIDDDEISREVLSMMLEAHGFPVETAEDGALALAKLETEQVEVILMDTQMPGLSGLDLIAALRQSSPARSSPARSSPVRSSPVRSSPVRIIAISGSEVSEAIRSACDGFLLKPVEADDLVRLLAAGKEAKPVADAIGAEIQPQDRVIDPAVLGRLVAMMPPAAVREIYDAVAADLKKRLALLEDAMDAGNSGEVSRIAHSIKGGSAMVGFSMATGAAGRLEASNLRETWPKELLQLQDALQALESILSGEFPT